MDKLGNMNFNKFFFFHWEVQSIIGLAVQSCTAYRWGGGYKNIVQCYPQHSGTECSLSFENQISKKSLQHVCAICSDFKALSHLIVTFPIYRRFNSLCY